MTEIPSAELRSAAEKLIKWDKWRSRTAKVLGYDVTVAPKPNYAEDSRAWAVGDFRVIPSLVVASRVARANRNFCGTVSGTLGAERLSAKDDIPPKLVADGHPRDPLVEFPNGLILKSVDAAHYVLDQSVEVTLSA